MKVCCDFQVESAKKDLLLLRPLQKILSTSHAPRHSHTSAPSLQATLSNTTNKMKFALLAAAALTGSTANAEIYFKEQFNDDVRFYSWLVSLIFFAMPPIGSTK